MPTVDVQWQDVRRKLSRCEFTRSYLPYSHMGVIGCWTPSCAGGVAV